MKRAIVRGFLSVWLIFTVLGLLTLFFPGPLMRESTQDMLLGLLVIPLGAVVPGIIGAGVAAAFYRYRQRPFSAGMTDQQLQEMFANPGASPEAMDAARGKLEKRWIRVVIVPQKATPDRDYEILPNGRRRFLRATTLDIVLSALFPPWGVIGGAIAFFIRAREEKRKDDDCCWRLPLSTFYRGCNLETTMTMTPNERNVERGGPERGARKEPEVLGLPRSLHSPVGRSLPVRGTQTGRAELT